MGAAYAIQALPPVKPTNSTYQWPAATTQVLAPAATGNRSLQSAPSGVANWFATTCSPVNSCRSSPGSRQVDPNFSADGKWVAYISYPDHTLWRSRSDGSERMQLTYPPMEVAFPFISPDGTKVAFSGPDLEIYVVSMDGGLPQRIIEKLNRRELVP